MAGSVIRIRSRRAWWECREETASTLSAHPPLAPPTLRTVRLPVSAEVHRTILDASFPLTPTLASSSRHRSRFMSEPAVRSVHCDSSHQGHRVDSSPSPNDRDGLSHPVGNRFPGNWLGKPFRATQSVESEGADIWSNRIIVFGGQ